MSGKTFWKEGAQDTGSRRSNEVVTLLDQFKKGSEGGPRTHCLPAPS